MMRMIGAVAVLALGHGTMGMAEEHTTPYPDGATVYFVELEDGDTVSSPVTIRFGLSGMGVAPAGVTEKENVGHHHLLVNRPPFGEGEYGDEEWDYGIVADDNHIHFGGGQTEVTLELPVGEHTLQMVLGDHSHVPFGPELSTTQITISVE